MKVFQASDMTALHTKMADWHLDAKKADFDIVTQADTALMDVMARAESMEFNWNVKNLWLTQMRWRALTKQYLDPEATEAWMAQSIERVGKTGRGIAILRTKTVQPRGGFGFSTVTRKWGSCILSVSYRARPNPQITLHSRTSYLGYLGALDMNVAWNLGRYVAREIGIPLNKMSFVWKIDSLQWHYFKSMAYMLNHPDEEEREWFRWFLVAPDDEISAEEERDYLGVRTGRPVVRGARRWLAKILAEDETGKTYGDMTYNTYRRVRRRYHREILGEEYAKQFEGFYYPRAHAKEQRPTFYKVYPPLPDLWTNTLDLSPIGMPLDRHYGEAFMPVLEDEEPEFWDYEDIGDYEGVEDVQESA